ncbi:MAG TPA: hypothetical protein VJT73_00815 [Polyangiaceae bacterium]|nr:hypothetical protein [Polyangiaceae bacterium]
MALLIRNVALALAFPLAGAACSLILDADSLKGGGSSSGTGSGDSGTTSDADAAATNDAGPQICESDLDCQGKKLEACVELVCGPDKKCKAPRPHAGLGIEAVTDVQTILEADDIGYPSLYVDQAAKRADIVMGVWVRSKEKTDVALFKYTENPSIGAGSTTLRALFPTEFAAFSSSPGLAAPAFTQRLRMLFAAVPAGQTAARMFQYDLAAAGTGLALAPMQPTKRDLGDPNFDANPAGPVPRMVGTLSDPWGFWVQQGQLHFTDGTNAGSVFIAKQVLDFAPIVGVGGPYAVLTTADSTGSPGSQAIEVWARDNPSLNRIPGDEAGRHRGLAAVWVPEIIANYIVWSFDKDGAPRVKTGAAICGGPTCTSGVPPTQASDSFPAAFPQAATAQITGTERDIVQSFQVFAPSPVSAIPRTALVATALRATFQMGDTGTKVASTTMNPSIFFVTAVDSPEGVALGEAIGPSSLAITSSGHIVAVWVEHTEKAKAALKMRRFQVKACP